MLLIFLSSALSLPLSPYTSFPSNISLTCPLYNCRSPSTTSSFFSICLLYSNFSIPSYSLIGCHASSFFNNFCDTSSLNTSDPSTFTVYCSIPELSFTSLYPGEGPCSSNSTCVSNICENGVCAGLPMNEPCSQSAVCEPGLSCQPNSFNTTLLCQPLVRPNQGACFSDLDCVNSAGCDFNATGGVGVCRPYFSVPVGGEILQCPGNVSLLCAQLQCSNSSTGHFYCVAPKTSSQLPMPCQKDLDCASSDGTLFSQCQCGMNSYAQAFCAPFPGDKVVVSMVKILKQWVSSLSILSCSNTRRWSFECMKKWKFQRYDELRYRILEYQMYALWQENLELDCVRDVMTYLYWDAKENYEISQSGAREIGYLAGIVFLAKIIII
jgi:hypothetical protein